MRKRLVRFTFRCFPPSASVKWVVVGGGVGCDAHEGSCCSLNIAYFVAFGPHGPRTPTSQPGDGLKILLAVTGLVGASVVLHQVVRRLGRTYLPSYRVVCVDSFG